MDAGKYEGVAPSMWAFPPWFWRMSGSCATYVSKKSWMLRKNYWGKPAQKIAKNRSSLGTYMAQLTCFEWELSHLSPAFCIWHRWLNSRIWAICSGGEYLDLKAFLMVFHWFSIPVWFSIVFPQNRPSSPRHRLAIFLRSLWEKCEQLPQSTPPFISPKT